MASAVPAKYNKSRSYIYFWKARWVSKQLAVRNRRSSNFSTRPLKWLLPLSSLLNMFDKPTELRTSSCTLP